MTTPSIEEVARKLTKAQRDVMRGHLVEISPAESSELEELGLKGEMTFEWVRVRKMTWPTTPLGLAVREYLKGISDAR